MKKFQKIVCAILLIGTFSSCVPYQNSNNRDHRREKKYDEDGRQNRNHDRGNDHGDDHGDDHGEH